MERRSATGVMQDAIKDELALHDDAPSLDQLIRNAIRLDNHLRERRRERNIRPGSGLLRNPSPNRSPPRPQLSAEPEPMQIGRAQLTPQERAHRRASNLCLYCGKPGHFIAHCPTRPVKGAAHP